MPALLLNIKLVALAHALADHWYKGTDKQMRRLALDSTLRMRVLQRVVLTDSGSIDGGVESDLRSRGLLPLEDAEGALLPPVLIKRPVTARTKPPP